MVLKGLVIVKISYNDTQLFLSLSLSRLKFQFLRISSRNFPHLFHVLISRSLKIIVARIIPTNE